MPPRNVSGVMTSSGTTCSFSKPSAQMPRMKPNRLNATAVSARKTSIQTGWAILQRHEQACRGQNDQPQDDRLRRGCADIAQHDLEGRHRRRQNLVDGPGEAGKVDAERRVRDALRQQHQHDQSGHDERAIVDAFDLGDARADRCAEHDEVQARSRSRVRRCSAAACGPCAPSRTCRSRTRPADSSVLSHQVDKDVLERALGRAEILKPDSREVEILEQAR